MPTTGTPIEIPIVGRTKGLDKSISKAKVALLGFGAAVGGTVLSATREFQKFETGFREVGTLLGDISDNELDKLQKDIREVAKTFGEDTTVVSRAFYDSISAGIANAETAKDFASAAAKFATAGATDISTGVDLLSSALNAYQLKAEDATRVSDIMFATVRAGKTTVPELAHSFAQFGPPAASLGVKIEEVSAWLAQLTLVGTPTAQAATQIKAAFNELAKPTSALGKHFEAMAGKSFPQFIREGGSLGDALQFIRERADQTGKEMFEMSGSVEAAQAIIAATGPYGDRFKETIASIGDSAGATETAFGVMSESLDFNLRVLSAQMNDFKLAIGAVFVPLLIPVVTRVTELIPQMVNGFTEWRNSIGPISDIMGNIHANVVELGTAILGYFVPAIGQANQYYQALYHALIEMRDALNLAAIWDSLVVNVQEFGFAIAELGTRITDIFAPSIYSHLVPAATAAVLAISSLASPFMLALKAANFLWNHFGQELIPVLERLGEYVARAIDYVDDFGYHLVVFLESLLPVGTTMEDVWGRVKAVVSAVADAVSTVIDTVAIPAFNRYLDATRTITTSAIAAVASLGSSNTEQGQVIRNAWFAVRDGVAEVWASVYETLQTFTQSVIDFAIGLWDVYNTYIHPYLRVLSESFRLAFEVIRTIIELVIWPLLKRFIEWFLEIMVPIWKAAIQIMVVAAKLLGETTKQVWQHVIVPIIKAASAVIAFLMRRMAEAMDKLADAIRYVRLQIESIREGTFSLQSALEPFISFLTKVYAPAWRRVNSAIRPVLSSIRAVINTAREAIDVVKKVPGVGAIGNVLGKIPGFATGGIVTQPTLAMVGEAGPEAIIPLDKMRQTQPAIVVNVYGGLDSADSIGEKVEAALVRWQAHKGSLDFVG